MEVIVVKFPHIGEKIFTNLDVKTLNNCKRVCKNWNTFIEEKKFYWIGVIEKHDENIIDRKLNMSKKQKLFREIKMEAIRKFAKTLILEENHTRNTSLHIGESIFLFKISPLDGVHLMFIWNFDFFSVL